MIIKFPTGLYKSILPKNGAPGNVTYTISTQDPPLPVINVIQLPVAEEFRPAPDRIFTDEERREQIGELVFTVAKGQRSLPGSNVKAFEVGEILQFENQVPIEEINTIKAPDDVDIRHDTNLLDLESVGLSSDEIDEITKLSQQKQTELEADFVSKRREIENIDVDIKENQKKINETSKTTKAVVELYGITVGLPSDNEIFNKLKVNLTVLEKERDDLISARNVAASEVEDIYRSIVRISELVR